MKQALGKTGKSPVFPLNLMKLLQKLKFWNSRFVKIFVKESNYGGIERIKN
jgi:hypothetical protein